MTEPNVQPFYVRQRQDWAVGHVRQQHVQALFIAGEPAMFTLMWKVEDFEAGLVTRCTRCRQDPTSIEGRIQAVYQQPLTATCPVCYGTTFNGGIRAQIVRPAIFTDTDEDERKSGRGVVHQENASVETTEDFRARTGDYVFRRDGSRWQLSGATRMQVRTGYEHPTQAATSIGYARISASREDESSVAFIIPPTASALTTILNVTGPFPDVTTFPDVTHGPLIPASEVE